MVSWHEHGACPPRLYNFFFPENIWFTYYSPVPPMDHSTSSSIQSIQLFYTMTSPSKETMMYFNYTYAPNLTHQGAYIITEKSLTTI
jgi:hypothetical protein